MERYAVSQIVLALVGIVQAAFTAAGDATSSWVVFAWAAAGIVLFAEWIFRAEWLNSRPIKIGISIAVAAAVVGHNESKNWVICGGFSKP